MTTENFPLKASECTDFKASGILGETSEKRYSETWIPSKVSERKKRSL